MIEQIGNILFIGAGILWGIELLPQLYQTFRTRKVEDISLFYVAICFMAYIIFLVGCFFINNKYLLIAHLIPFVNVGILLYLILKYKEKRLRKYKVGNVTIKVNDEINVKELEKFLNKMGYKQPAIRELFTYNLRDTNKELKSLNNTVNVTARINKKLVGYLKIITDKSYFYYFTDVMVLPKFRGRKIGNLMIKKSLKYCKDNGFIKIFLTPARGLNDYYKRFGFKESNYCQMVILGKNE